MSAKIQRTRGKISYFVFPVTDSCGYASAAPEPQHNVLSHSASQFYVSPGESASAKLVREIALIEWQHAVARESRFVRSDMHASSDGLVFSAIHTEPDADEDKAA